MAKTGKVYLIGAGPGRPDLITVRGQAILKQAEVVIYDYLVDPAVFRGLSAELICSDQLGKKRYSDGFSDAQQKINNLIVKKSRQGKKVVRLKNGDAMIFSRISEELAALTKARIEFEIIPGVTAASASAAYAGQPLTSRHVASSVVFVTGHEAKDKESIDWQKIASLPSIVLYMAVENLAAIVAKLGQNGKSPHTPVTIVSRAGTMFQKTAEGNLFNIGEKAKGISAPAMILIGEHKKYNWFNKNKRILFTGLSDERFFLPGTYFHLPLIEIKPLNDYRRLDYWIKNLGLFDWLVFASRYGVKYFFDRLIKSGRDVRDLAGRKIAAVGQSTAGHLLSYGVKADLVPKIESSDGLISALKKEGLEYRLVFMSRSNLADKGLEKKIEGIGGQVVSCVAYNNVMPGNLPDLDLKFFNEVVFTSPSAARNFKKRYGKIPAGIKILSIGAVTEKEVKRVFRK